MKPMIATRRLFTVLSVILLAASWSLAGDTHDKQPIKIQLVVENFDESTTYQFAAAEVVRTQFAGEFEIVPDAKPLYLYIAGSGKADGCEEISISLRQMEYTFVAGRRVPGDFLLSESTGILCNFPKEHAAQSVKEHTYKVLSESLKKLADSQTVVEWLKQREQ